MNNDWDNILRRKKNDNFGSTFDILLVSSAQNLVSYVDYSFRIEVLGSVPQISSYIDGSFF